jgi:hypothetical protein
VGAALPAGVAVAHQAEERLVHQAVAWRVWPGPSLTLSAWARRHSSA